MIFAFLSVIATNLNAGDFLHYKLENKPGYFELMLEPTQMRINNSEDGKAASTSMIFVKAKMETLIVNHKKKEYMVLDKATMDKMAKRMGEASDKMQAAMKNMPPAMQEMMKKQMGGMMAPTKLEPVVIKKVGSGETAGKWKATHFQAIRGKDVLSDTWAVPLKEVGIDTANLEVFKAMSEMYSELTKQAKSMGPSASPVDIENWRSLEGFPVKTVSKSKMGERGYLLETVEKKSFASNEFAPPSEYKKSNLPGM